EEGFRCAVDPPVDGGPAFVVDQDHRIRIAELLQPAQGVLALVLPVVADDADLPSRGVARQHGVFLAAGRAPAAPDIEQVGLPQQFGRSDLSLRLVQQRQGELRRGTADQGRGQRFAVRTVGLAHAVEQQRDQAGEGGGDDDRGEATAVHCARTWRNRRSAAVTKPPSAISSAPLQIQRTNGLTCRRTAQVSPPSDSPSATNTSARTPAWMPASVITCPPLAYARFSGCSSSSGLPSRNTCTWPRSAM